MYRLIVRGHTAVFVGLCRLLRADGPPHLPPPTHLPPPPRPWRGSQAEKLVSKLDRVSVVSGEVGLALFRLSKAEEEEGGHLAQHTCTVRGGE